MKKLAVLFLLACLVSCKSGPEITQWRGENRSGNYPATNLLASWPDEGPLVVWETESLGNGYSSPIVSDEFVYATGEIDSLGYLFKLDHTGREVWRSVYGKEWTTNFKGSRGAPTLADNLIYVCSGLGDISCMNTETGEQLWSLNMVTDLQGTCPRFGFSQALVVNNEWVYCQPGGEQHNVVALNRFTGELVWSSAGFGERPGYNSPLLFEWGEKKILATFSAYHLLGIDAETGQLLWSQEQTNTKPEERAPGKGDTHANTILFNEGTIYYSAGDGNCGVKLQLNEDATGIEQLWQTPNLDNYMGGFVLANNHLYASSHRQNLFIAIDCETGMQTDSLKIGRGSTIQADGKLFFYGDKGTISLLEASAEGLRTRSSFKLTKGSKEHFAHPVIHGGLLYLRHGNYLGAYQIQRQS
ncbi:PQQ-binding-like beta-propeller repeat protein [uncultured Sunxiuqinia sp.]|uniref:PQQ-binding-like beta-propeller repeat protein n=1 Tax=uncultured Sunxiuqinia sp. TaxID=1573825 RepID=UPI002631B10D|nr:PQQ-binding-like beta-propeller repeat protein [uncultured Sunxiuqinia sp.]